MAWTTIQLPTKHDLRGVWCDGKGLVIVVGDDGIFRSTDDGATWAAVPSGVKSYILGIGGTHENLFVVTGGGNVLRSTNGGAAWKKEKSPKAGGPIHRVVALADGRAWAGGVFARSATGAWSTTDRPVSWIAADGTLWGLGKDEILWSRDGAKWTTHALEPYARATDGCCAGDAVLLATAGGVHRSVDKGKTWTTVLSVSWDVNAIWSDGDKRVFAGFRRGELHESRDGGATWKKIATGDTVGAGCIVGERVVYVARALHTTPALGAKAIDARPAAAPAAKISDDEALLDRLLVRWRETRSTKLADRIDALSERAAANLPEVTSDSEYGMNEVWLERAAAKRSGDLARLFAVFTRAHSRHHIDERLESLETWPADPRIATLLAGFFQTPQWTGEHAKRFWARAGEMLVATGDRRALAVLDKIDTARDRSYLSGWFARNLPKLRERLGATTATELSAKELAAIDKEIGAVRNDSPDALLAEIYAHPDDDAPRLVYADAVGGDRGEFIVAQINGGEKKRIAELLKKHARTWLGAIEPAVLPGEMVFERGFLARCRVQVRNDRVAAQMLGKPEWATVRAIDVANWQGDAWLEHVRALPALRELTGATIEILDGEPLPYTRLGLGRGSYGTHGSWIPLLAKTKNLPQLRSLELRAYWGPPEGFAKLWKTKPQLAHVECTSRHLAAWFEQLSNVQQIDRFEIHHDVHHGPWSVRAVRDGKRFAVEARHQGKNVGLVEQLWAQLALITPSRLSRLALPRFAAMPLAEQIAKRFPETELA